MNERCLCRGFYACEEGESKVFINGKRVVGKWVYGFPAFIREPTAAPDAIMLWNNDGSREIIGIIPETFGWRAGASDMKGNLIFEGDIIRGVNFSADRATEERWRGTVVRGVACFEIAIGNDFRGGFRHLPPETTEIIGNVFSNPDRLKRK